MMKSDNLYTKIILNSILFIFLFSSAYSCIEPQSETSITVTEDTSLCPSSYTDLEIIITNNSITFDCNNSILLATGIFPEAIIINANVTDTTIANCEFDYYDKAITIDQPTGIENLNIVNTVFYDNTISINAPQSNTLNIKDSYFEDVDYPIRLLSAKNINIHNNIFVNTIKKTIFISTAENINSISIYNNSFSNSDSTNPMILINTPETNINIEKNIFENINIAIRINSETYISGITITDNQFNGIYDTIIELENIQMSEISNNNFNSFFSNGIQLKGIMTFDNEIKNNIFNNSDSNEYAIEISESSNSNTINANIFENTNYIISLSGSQDNMIYDNIFNIITAEPIFNNDDSNNFYKSPSCNKNNIIGEECIAGNYWQSESEPLLSQLCTDNNRQSICDTEYKHSENVIDKYPLTFSDKPVFEILSPTNNSTINTTSTMLKINLISSNITECWYKFNDSSNPISNCNQTSFNSNKGYNNITAYAKNEIGMISSQFIEYNIDYGLENYSIIINEENTNQNNITIKINSEEPVKLNIDLELNIDPVTSYETENFKKNHTILIKNLLPETTYDYIISICDKYNNCNTEMGHFITNKPEDNMSFDIIMNLNEWHEITTNLSEFTTKELQELNDLMLMKKNITIHFMDKINISRTMDFDNFINFSKNKININTEELPELNKNATLIFYKINFTKPAILRNDEECSEEICHNPHYDEVNLIYTVDVSGFSTYEIIDQCEITPHIKECENSNVTPIVTTKLYENKTEEQKPAPKKSINNGLADKVVAYDKNQNTHNIEKDGPILANNNNQDASQETKTQTNTENVDDEDIECEEDDEECNENKKDEENENSALKSMIIYILSGIILIGIIIITLRRMGNRYDVNKNNYTNQNNMPVNNMQPNWEAPYHVDHIDNIYYNTPPQQNNNNNPLPQQQNTYQQNPQSNFPQAQYETQYTNNNVMPPSFELQQTNNNEYHNIWEMTLDQIHHMKIPHVNHNKHSEHHKKDTTKKKHKK